MNEYPVIEGGAYGHDDPFGKKQPEDEGRDNREGDGYPLSVRDKLSKTLFQGFSMQ